MAEGAMEYGIGGSVYVLVEKFFEFVGSRSQRRVFFGRLVTDFSRDSVCVDKRFFCFCLVYQRQEGIGFGEYGKFGVDLVLDVEFDFGVIFIYRFYFFFRVIVVNIFGGVKFFDNLIKVWNFFVRKIYIFLQIINF